MDRYKVYKYVVYEGEIAADNKADAATLMKYGKFPDMWKQVGNPKYKLDGEGDNKVVYIKGMYFDDNKSEGNY